MCKKLFNIEASFYVKFCKEKRLNSAEFLQISHEYNAVSALNFGQRFLTLSKSGQKMPGQKQCFRPISNACIWDHIVFV